MMPAGPCRSLPRSERDIMCSNVGGVAPEFEPPLSEDLSKGMLPSDGHAWPLLKFVVCINLILLVVSVSVLAFGGSSHGLYDENQTRLSSAYGLNQYLDKGIQLVTQYGMESNNPDWSCLCEAIHSRFTNLHLKFSEVAFIRANMHGIANYIVELVNVYRPSTNSFKEFWDFDGSIAINNDEGISRQNSATHVSRMSSSVLKKGRERSHSLRKAKIASFLNIIKDLMHEGLLQSHHRVLCLDSDAVNEVRALKKKGFSHLEHVDVSLSRSSSKQRSSHSLVEGFTDKTFDCVFTTVFDHTADPLLFIAEIERILKVGGLAVMHCLLMHGMINIIEVCQVMVQSLLLYFSRCQRLCIYRQLMLLAWIQWSSSKKRNIWKVWVIWTRLLKHKRMGMMLEFYQKKVLIVLGPW